MAAHTKEKRTNANSRSGIALLNHHTTLSAYKYHGSLTHVRFRARYAQGPTHTKTLTGTSYPYLDAEIMKGKPCEAT